MTLRLCIAIPARNADPPLGMTPSLRVSGMRIARLTLRLKQRERMDHDDVPQFDGRRRVIIEGVEPEIDCGRFAAKRIVGELVTVEADIFADGHDLIAAELLFRHEGSSDWSVVPMTALVNDRWRGEFLADALGRYHFTIQAWIDHFATWRRDLRKRMDAGEELDVHLEIGARFVDAAITRETADGATLKAFAATLRDRQQREAALRQLFHGDVAMLIARNPDRTLATRYVREVTIDVERPKARFSSWYELFPRSMGEGLQHGTLRDVIARLPYVASMGFDVLYLPPIHPIGDAFRKGKNNAVSAAEGEPGSPWAVGGAAGGHLAIHPELGTLQDFDDLVIAAKLHDIEIALDIAFQASPDHPLVKEHPEFFLWRPDGSVQYAENPPKKYQDIYPFHFESEAWEAMWGELRDVFLFWVDRGVRVFRVDNPHTKPLPFWEWTISEVKKRNQEVIFLAEAFTRPKIMYYLAKAGFTQSYTYFTWRNTKSELVTYFTELTKTKAHDYFRPNAWPNTPDILPEFLQSGMKSAFQLRVVLAATLSASYGIYGPAYELLEHTPRLPGAEEYLDSEKYEVKDWNVASAESLAPFIARLNRIRKENPALHRNDTLRFHLTDNDNLICYSKSSLDGENVVLTIVNLDPYTTQSGNIFIDEEGELGESYQVHDLLSGQRFLWKRGGNFVQINPHIVPAHVFRIRRRVRSEHDFEYYL
jgi:starch synthase (maltosyl-transferring)